MQIDAAVKVYDFVQMNLVDTKSKDEHEWMFQMQMFMIILMDASVNVLTFLKFMAYLFGPKDDFKTRMHVVEALQMLCILPVLQIALSFLPLFAESKVNLYEEAH